MTTMEEVVTTTTTTATETATAMASVHTSCRSCFTICRMTGTLCCNFFHKEYTEYTTRTGTKAYANVGIIPLNGERNMLLKIGNIVFVDSCQFLATSLNNLVKALQKSGVDKFANTVKHFRSDDDAYFEKGCYPSKLDETELPPKSAFYNPLPSSAKNSTTSSTSVRSSCGRNAA